MLRFTATKCSVVEQKKSVGADCSQPRQRRINDRVLKYNNARLKDCKEVRLNFLMLHIALGDTKNPDHVRWTPVDHQESLDNLFHFLGRLVKFWRFWISDPPY
ncbi:MAG: hypothetical protein A2X81_02575 [Desulfobacterales bacterium GWB2_56_26]|nr:MAG: hypothetical protein A2X81_02575 [Desulfobacterales bacterium GWB2_56_26]